MTFMSGSVACRINDYRFLYMMDYWLRTLGADRFVTFMSGSVACRINDEPFLYMMDYWLRTLGADRFVTFMSGSVACRINDEPFLYMMDYWLRTLGADRFVTFMSDSVACGINDYMFLICCDYWLRTLGADKFVTFMSAGTAIALEDKDSSDRLLILHASIEHGFHTLMRGGIGSHLHCESTFDVIMIWLARFGVKLFVQAFSKTTVVSLVVIKERFDLLEQLYNEYNQNAIILYSILFTNKNCVFHQHFSS